MILQALVRYYDILTNDPDSGIAPPGYSITGVSFALNLSPQGELLDVFHLFDKVDQGKKTVELPRRMLVPEQVKRASGISANFLCDNSAYVLGLSGKEMADPEYAIKRYQAFCKLNQAILANVLNVEAKAVIAFQEMYDPLSGNANPIIAAHLEEMLKGGNIVFKLDGQAGFIHDAPEIRCAWEAYKAEAGNKYLGQCLVTGELAPIARLHPSLKRIAGANPTGATLVGFNARAYESYNRTEGQGLNSPVSEKAAFAYTTALNYLLSPENPNKKFSIGDTTVVYWAESKNPEYATIFEGLFEPDWNGFIAGETGEDNGRDRRAELRLKEIGEKVKRGEALDVQGLLVGLDPATQFYVLGLAPNAARVSVRFFHMDPFQKIVQKILAHYADLQIVKEYDDQPNWISIRKILEETVSKNSSDPKASPLLGGTVFRSILDDAPYPAALYYALINRIRADVDDSRKHIKKIHYVRAAIIKAYLTRKYRNQPQQPFQEVLVMSLNEQSSIPAYVLGRLFAVLEKVQQEAIGDVNASIKDRFFTSACASPASVFPVLLRLSQHHISKAEYGRARDRRIEEILNLLDVEKNPIPAHLTLDEQGVFVLGYYHERTHLYAGKNHTVQTEQPSIAL